MNRSSASRAVAIWIGIGVFMLLVQVILGGVTRLTGSGLSITEWNVITGALPPLNEHDWIAEFNKYKQTPQFQLLNTGFTLSDFKFIFFWEWMHRLWARSIGVVFIIGFVYLLAKKYLKKEMVKPLLILFLLGAMQGAVGWIMVASGLTGDAVYVKPTRLAMHFIFAMVLIAYAYWFLLELVIGKHKLVSSPRSSTHLRQQERSRKEWSQQKTNLCRASILILVLIVVQLIFGALMAGHKAATAASTWPDINGSGIPADLFKEKPFLLNFIDNKITIHFVHRTLAYLILILTVIFTFRIYRIPDAGSALKFFRPFPLIFVLIQVILGISALLLSPHIIPNHWGAFEWLAQFHQVVGMLLALSFVSFTYLLKSELHLT